MKKRAVALCGITVLTAAAVVTPAAVADPAAAPPRATPHGTPHLTWKKCGTDDRPTLQCASLAVPLDHGNTEGRWISLALSRVPHTAKTSQGPLLVNPGGPGGSGLSLAGFVASSLPAKVAAQYDVIGFDPRGVGRSEPALDCAPGHFDPVRPPSVPGTPAIEQRQKKRADAFARACETKYHDVLPYLDTVSAAKDMDLIRAALGAQRINYFGYSYGTYLGAVYAKYFPQRVRRLVLDSIVDPEGAWYRDNLDQDLAFHTRHQAFMAWVAKYDATYKLGKDPAKIEAKWYAMRDAVAKKPAGGRVGAGELEDTFLPGGYYNGYWPQLAEAFSAYVNRKDTETLVAAYETFGEVDAAGDNGYSVYTAVQCRDARWPRDWHRWNWDNTATHQKAPFSTWNNAWYNAPCATWPVPPLERADITNDALPPALLFQATDDAATPYEGGVKVHELLRGSSLVVEQGGGNHGITLSGSACLDGHLSAYLATGKVPRGRGAADAVCRRQPDPKPPATREAAAPAAVNGASLHRLLGFRAP
ncbi:alpha/beta hydrolase [Streptomyces sp. NPDC088785]|uniref:alpha/beta hydrolase n=1 Tax=Streptomyces sp. NPDC088785 TaxID=3365897 RepID=UPI00380FD633